MSHLFEEFYRAPNAKALEREGTGLGLTIVKDMVNRFGGEISVESSTETGSKFTITLPVNTQGVHQPDLHAVQRKAEE
jgi:signal transduction histidine kinase